MGGLKFDTLEELVEKQLDMIMEEDWDSEGKKKLIGDVLEVYIQLKSELGESLV
jgi:hypothetical protein